MLVKEVTDILEELAPLAYAEDFDNVGLLVGDTNIEVSGILVTLDTLENVVDEAIENNCNLIVSFHPIIFSGLKKITGKTYVERVVIKAIKNNITIYSMHTALDNSKDGVNAKICEVLGIENPEILIPQKRTIKKLTTYVPEADAEILKNALFEAGAGNIGNYSHCSFVNEGTGSFQAETDANPVKGNIGEIHFEKETQIHVTYQKSQEGKVLNALFKNHPYDEVAFEVYSLENTNQHIGMGMIGTLKNPMEEMPFLNHVKKTMHASGIRHSNLIGKSVQKIAVLGGSGAFAISAAKAAGADVFITADIKYHQFYEAEDQIVIADIGHYETEQFTKNLLVDYLTKKIPNFAVRLAESKTNPIKYL
ncbi:Nif3-like dinuclear metal center hexameric protein [Maribacter algarum]|uniref:GTP cyclohydrolase 1 type 2 homolog n=1 Tax=Maribacter algarum (ex Zhang et al. 2020) TaxID=2578118 RepID=A0A5S3PNW0_9FLAO|nr:Nif3-like dinuclear metal center hexameric protein [Maribacter algarum]TMM56113.1 Nif3-like dinuclear metal center hexameric protein [Maribacter algarum]